MAFKQRAPMRIRNISPKIYQNYDLFASEKQTGLPIFKTLTGLWCHADREGRFVWDVRKLQINIHPYWPDVDIEATLAILVDQDVVRRYVVDGKTYGWLVTFKEYQYISHNEPASMLPAPGLDEGSGSVPGANSEESGSAPPDNRRLTTDGGRLTKDVGRQTTDDRLEPEAPRSERSRAGSSPSESKTEKPNQSGRSYIPRAQADRQLPFNNLETKRMESDAEFQREIRQFTDLWTQTTGQPADRPMSLSKLLYENGLETATRVLDWAYNRSDYWFKTEKGKIKGIPGFVRAFSIMLGQWQKHGCPATVAEEVSAKKPQQAVRAGTMEFSREELGVGPAFFEDEEPESFVVEDVEEL